MKYRFIILTILIFAILMDFSACRLCTANNNFASNIEADTHIFQIEGGNLK